MTRVWWRMLIALEGSLERQWGHSRRTRRIKLGGKRGKQEPSEVRLVFATINGRVR